jgi:transposase
MEKKLSYSELEQKFKELEAVVELQLKVIAQHEEAFRLQSEISAQWEEKANLLSDRIALLEEAVKAQAEINAKQEALIRYYEEQFKITQRKQFGSSSERSPDQLYFENMFNEAEDQADSSLPEPEIEEITYKRVKRVGKRKEDLEGLPVERVEHELPESERGCPECGEAMEDIGVTIRNELKIVPAQVINEEHATHKYVCKNKNCNCNRDSDSKAPIIGAESPTPLISGSLASASAVAHIATQKFVNGIPLYRIEKGLAYDGVVLSRQNMSNWLIYCTQNYLVSIYSLLIPHFLKEDIGHADETTLQVLHEPGRPAKSKSYMWLYRTGIHSKCPVVIFEYQETRSHEHPENFLRDFRGYLHCDGYQAYHNLGEGIIVNGCWAHMRRYWEHVYESIAENKREGSNAERGLVYCNLLFAFEEEFQKLDPDERKEKRKKYSRPVSDDYFEWVDTLSPLPKSLMGDAVTYARNQRGYLENIYLDGRLELSNNLAERSLRPFVQGKKQWLFSNTPNGAESSSILYSIVETAKANNLNPFQYIKYLLEMLPNITTSNLESLLPWSETLPDICRVPVKASNVKPERPKYSSRKGPLYKALQKLRERYRDAKA